MKHPLVGCELHVEPGRRGRFGRREEFEPRWPAEIRQAALELRRRGIPRRRIRHFFCLGISTLNGWLRDAGLR